MKLDAQSPHKVANPFLLFLPSFKEAVIAQFPLARGHVLVDEKQDKNEIGHN